jgi:hypothetical protein
MVWWAWLSASAEKPAGAGRKEHPHRHDFKFV